MPRVRGRESPYFETRWRWSAASTRRHNKTQLSWPANAGHPGDAAATNQIEHASLDGPHSVGHDNVAQIFWSYSPTSGNLPNRASRSAKIARILDSEAGLSTTTTSDGLLEDA